MGNSTSYSLFETEEIEVIPFPTYRHQEVEVPSLPALHRSPQVILQQENSGPPPPSLEIHSQPANESL